MPAFDSITAEIELETRNDLPVDLGKTIAARLSPGDPVEVAIAETVFRDDRDLLSKFVYARTTPDLVYLVWKQGAQQLKVHVQRRSGQSSLPEVPRSAESLAEQFRDFANFHRCRVEKLIVKISARGSELQSGTKPSRWSRVRKALADESTTVLTVGLAAILISYFARDDVPGAMLDGAIAAGALVLRGLLTLVLNPGGEFEYE